MIEGHGDDLFRYKGRIRYNFSSNIYQGMDHAALFNHLSERMEIIGSYPEPEPRSLEEKLAEALGIDRDNVYVAGGATEIIYHIAALNSGKRSAILSATFAEYEDACLRHGHEIAFFNDISGIPESDIVWLCNPNNPTGQVVEANKLKRTVQDNPVKLFVIDQAYGKYCREEVIVPGDVVKFPNLLILCSLTKDFSVPGLRIGYAVGSAEAIGSLKHQRIPWSVNALALEAAGFLLDHSEDYRIDLDRLLSEASRVRAAFKEIGIESMPTATNFFLCRLPQGKASDLKEWLAEGYGILIRDASNFHGLDERYFRIAVQDNLSNDILIKAMKEWICG